MGNDTTNGLHFSVYFLNSSHRVNLLAVFEHGKMKTVNIKVSFNKALNKPEPKKVILKPRKSIVERLNEIQEGMCEGLSEVVN